jgi:hypothetical protein
MSSRIGWRLWLVVQREVGVHLVSHLLTALGPFQSTSIVLTNILRFLSPSTSHHWRLPVPHLCIARSQWHQYQHQQQQQQQYKQQLKRSYNSAAMTGLILTRVRFVALQKM